jgi:hypothetical protein
MGLFVSPRKPARHGIPISGCILKVPSPKIYYETSIMSPVKYKKSETFPFTPRSGIFFYLLYHIIGINPQYSIFVAEVAELASIASLRNFTGLTSA